MARPRLICTPRVTGTARGGARVPKAWLLLAVLGLACDRGAEPRQVRLESFPADAEEAGAPGRSPLRLGVAPVISPSRSLVLYSGLAEFLGRRLDREVRILQRDSYAEVNDLVRLRQCDLAFVCTYAYVLGEKNFGMQLLVVPQIGGQTVYHSYIVVPRASEAKSLLDLRGKRFASADVLSNTGWLFPCCWLKERGEDPDRFFRDVMFTGSPSGIG